MTDFNECEYDNGECEQNCINDIPGHHCECYIGFELNENGVNCTSECVHAALHV